MRAIWSGALSFGLVNIPIKLYSATRSVTLDFDYLHKKDLSPIRYARVCRLDGQEIPYSDLVKGYEYRKGDYVVLVDEDFKRANLRITKTIDVQNFTLEDEIDSIYFEKPYYLVPDKNAQRAYVLLLEALKKSKKVGVAKFVLRTREHLAVIKPYKNIILLDQMRYEDEITQPDEIEIKDTSIATGKEIEMALALIDQLSRPFEPDKYKDTYREELERVIKEKVEGKVPEPKGEEPQPTNVRDLMSVLKESLEKERQRVSVAA